MKRPLVLLLAGIGLMVAASLASGFGPAYNATPSIAKGFYWKLPVASTHEFARGDLACHHWSSPRWAAGRPGYPPDGIALCKRVALLAGDPIEVAHNGDAASLKVPDWAWPTAVRQQDSRGRALPDALSGLGTVPAGHLVLMGEHPHSLDDRYLGPTRRADVSSRLVPLWTWGGVEPLNTREIR